MSYVTVPQLKAYLKISGNGEDDLLQTFCTRAQGLIDGRTQTTFEVAATSTLYFDALEDVVDGRDLFFGRRWCAGITQVVNGDGTTVASASYVTLPRNLTPIMGLRLKLTADAVWTFTETPEEAIAVTGYWGWSRTPPEEISAAALRLAAFLYRQKDAGFDVDRVAQTADGVTLMPARLPADVAELLAPYLPKL